MLRRAPTCLLLTTLLLLPCLAHADVPNDDPVLAEITSPTDGQMFEGPTAMIDVALEVDEGDFGISRIELMLDSETVMTDMEAPWEFTGVEVASGTHTLATVAYSAADGNGYPSMPVQIVVFESDDGGTSAGGGESEEEKKGCSVGDGRDASAWAVFSLIAIGLVVRRRRRRRGS